jgi:hypothetical protein
MSSGRMSVSIELERLWKEAAVINLGALSEHLPRMTEEYFRQDIRSVARD